MTNRIVRLSRIKHYVSDHPYSTCQDIATHLNRHVTLIQSDVRMLYRSGVFGRRKGDNSKSRVNGNTAYEYYVTERSMSVI